jgi:thioredoxin reductase (NADPH)
MSKIYDMIIIGGGPAGYTAALYGARAGLSTLLIEKMTIGGQMTETGDIDNYPGFNEGIDGITLGMKMQAGAERFGAETIYDEVTSVKLDREIKEINTAFSDMVYGKTVVIAAGAGPRRLGLDGEEELIGQGIHYCAHCDGRFYKDKTVAVIGGGNTAVGDALYLANLAKKVYLIHRRDTFRASAVLSDALSKTENIELVLSASPKEILSDGELNGLKVALADGSKRDITCDGVFVSIGRVPASSLFEGVINLDSQGYIIAGEDTKTSLDGVFAAGDVRTKTLRQVITAAADGAIAAHEAGEYLAKIK